MMYMNHQNHEIASSAAMFHQPAHQRSSSVTSSVTSSPPSVSPPQLLTASSTTTTTTNSINLAALTQPSPTNYILPYYFATNPSPSYTLSTTGNLRCHNGYQPNSQAILGGSTFLTTLDPNSTGLKTFAESNFLYAGANKTLFTSTGGATLPNGASLNDPYKLSQLYLLNPSKTSSLSATRTASSLLSTGAQTAIISCDPFSRTAASFKSPVSSILASNPAPQSTFHIPFSSFAVDMKGKRPKKRFKKPPELRKVLPKNSLMLLHELRPNVEYRFVSQSGPIHRPLFTMCVDINEHKFEGIGKTKKLARMEAAQKAVDFLIKNPEYIQKTSKSAQSTASAPSSTSESVSNGPDAVAGHEIGGEDDDEDEDECGDTSDENDESCATKKLKN